MEVTWCGVVLCALTFCCTLPWSDGQEPSLALCFNGYRYAHYQHFVNWTTARDMCQTINSGNLTSIDNQAQQDYLFSNFRGFSVSVWIGLNDIKDEGIFLWVDGSPLNFTNWNGTESNNTFDNEHCVQMRRRSGTWRVLNCTSTREFLCRETVPAPGEWTECGGREWRMFQENMTWSNAERTCQSYGGHLAYLEDNQPRTTCAKKVLQTCFRDGPQISMAYVGLTNIFDLGAYRWVRDNSMNNTPHTGSRVCSTYSNDDLVGLNNCSVEYPFICERPLLPNRPPFTTSCNGSNMTYNTLAFSWQHANNSCVSTGGRLLEPAALDERNCALRLYATNFSADPTVQNIKLWVSLIFPGYTNDTTMNLCPKWEVNLSNSDTQNFSCVTPAPYICVYEFNSCESSPCRHNASCVNTFTSFECICQTGTTGRICQTEIVFSTEPPNKSDGFSIEIIVGIAVGVVAIAIVVAVVVAVFMKRKQRKRTESTSQLSDTVKHNFSADTLNGHGAGDLTKDTSSLAVSPGVSSTSELVPSGNELFGMTNAAYLANDEKIIIDTVPVSYINNEASENDRETVQEAMYDTAGPRYFYLEKDEERPEEKPEARYVMTGLGATKTSSPQRDVQPGSDTAAHIYSQVVKARNTIPYQSPPNGEKEIYSTLKRKIYVHLDRKSVHLDQQIGIGNFGYVMKGTWRRQDNVTVSVAVKSLRPDVKGGGKVEFLKEALIMGQFYHHNVVTMHGVVVDSDPYLLVLELMKTELRPYLFGLREKNKTLTPLLTHFTIDIASGMEYLSSREFVHRDLAARNVLLDDKLTCKIADFGMSRNLDDGDYYISQNTGSIPVKWTAPEALKYSRYSASSDVWSFAVVVYEIFAFGRKPFFGMKNDEVLDKVCEGYRLERPNYCPQRIYDLQTKCWDEDPHRRPSFSELRQLLQSYENEHATGDVVSG